MVDRVKELIAGYLADHGIELVEIIYRREQEGMVLRLLVDTPQGITIQECEELNKYIGDTLDKEDFISDHYIIEVSSPGLDRPIVTDRDFERSMGKELTISLYEPISGNRRHEGKLVETDKDNIAIDSGGVKTILPRNKIAKAVLKIDF
ncbi:MAG: ribosome maturation factor RimP [Candidatus Omnitrophota bacterium]